MISGQLVAVCVLGSTYSACWGRPNSACWVHQLSVLWSTNSNLIKYCKMPAPTLNIRVHLLKFHTCLDKARGRSLASKLWIRIANQNIYIRHLFSTSLDTSHPMLKTCRKAHRKAYPFEEHLQTTHTTVHQNLEANSR
jgi:hypothetical protein